MLHHLEFPSEGLAALKSVLSERGGMNIMLYAKYGRTGVYHIQELMRRINTGVINRSEEIINTKLILNILPSSNWFKHKENLFNDISNYGDIGIYDLLLHKQDRCYSIPEMYEFIEQQNLNFVEFSTVDTRTSLKPENYIKDLSLLKKIKSLDTKEQQAICEIIKGNITKHTFYISNNRNAIADLVNLDHIPYFYAVDINLGIGIANLITVNNLTKGKMLGINLNSYFLSNHFMNIHLSDLTIYILKNIDGYRSLGEIFDIIKNESCDENISLEYFINEVKLCLIPFIDTGILLLRNKSIEHFAIS